MTNQDAFYKLWQAVSGLSGLNEFPFDNFNEEDIVLAEAMAGEGLTRLMYFKKHLANAKHKLQTPDLQRGVLPQTEEGKESVCVETDTDKAEADRETLSALFRSKELNGRNYPHLHGEGESFIQWQPTTPESYVGETKDSTIGIQSTTPVFFGEEPDLRIENGWLLSGSNGDSPHEGSGE